jgi:hypothetical protein
MAKGAISAAPDRVGGAARNARRRGRSEADDPFFPDASTWASATAQCQSRDGWVRTGRGSLDNEPSEAYLYQQTLDDVEVHMTEPPGFEGASSGD